MSKTWKWILISFLSIIVIGIIVLLVLGLSGKLSFMSFRNSYNTSNKKILDKQLDIENKDINIKSDATEINIINSDKNKIIVYGEDDELKFNDNNEISIEYKTKSKTFSFRKTIAKIDLYLDKEYDGKIYIENNFGNINIEKYKNAFFDIDEDAGTVKIETAEKVIINNEFGDIKVKKANEVIIDESAGKVSVGEVGTATIKNDAGKIEVSKVTNMLDIENDCGDIEIDTIDIKENSSVKCDLGSIRIKNTNDIKINAKTDLGKIKINKNNKLASIRLDIKNDCGDIKVN